jgi:coproporphyrinogen III oxidase-like Fe-S oxidoreductase
MKVLPQTVRFDADLLRKYDQPLPRYTSYPPATELTEDFAEVDFRAAIAIGNYKKTPLSLYCHIPFCESACYFCGCNTVITQQKLVAERYLDHLTRNIRQVAAFIDSDRAVGQLHWGGGTPNYLSLSQVETLWNTLSEHFKFDDQAEISIEVNPRSLDIEKGVKLDRDDIIRRTVIMELMCQFRLLLSEIAEKYHLNFDDDFVEYFANERLQLRLLEADGLIRLSPNQIEVTPTGRLLIRNIAAVFDRYLRDRAMSGFSRAI